MNKKVIVVAIAVALVVGGAVGFILLKKEEPQTLRLATTTSTYDSGLLDCILPLFEEENDCIVDVIAVGSGAAMTLGQSGDVDVLLVHSPAAEMTFVADGYGESRSQVMYNNFVIVGPSVDPIDTVNSTSAADAFQKIYDNCTAGNAIFISRADNSGTYTTELSIWASIGFNKTTVTAFSSDWYVQSGQGMGAVLDMAEEMDAYTLSDDATYYQRVADDLIPHLNMTYKGDSALFNQYSVIPVNATRWPHVNHTLAIAFKDWLVSRDGQDLIASYREYGMQLFFPNADGYVASAETLACVEAFTAACLEVPEMRITERTQPRMEGSTW